MATRCSLSAERRDRLAETYTELHEGLPPDRFSCATVESPNGRIRTLGRIDEIQYKKTTTEAKSYADAGVPSYWHPFAEYAAPTFGVDKRGKIYIYSGLYHVTTHGIEDLPRGRQHKERIPGPPKTLVALGKLEWIGYTYGVGRAQVKRARLSFSGSERPTLAHDENGNLHVLGGSYHIEEQTMARRRSRKHHRAALANTGRRHRRHIRPNPVEAVVGKPVSRMLMSSLIVGVGGAAAVVVGKLLLDKTTWTPYQKGAAEIGGGLVLGGIAVVAKAHPAIAAIFGIGGTLIGVVDIYHEWQAQRATQQQQQQQSSAPPAHTGPGAQAQLPGVPAGYQVYNQNGCAVAYR